ncbi:MAG: DNA repair protein RecO [candidate division WOR-3 bacterium]
MRRILRDEAVCLRIRDYKESSKLVVFFTRGRGRLSGIARGARRPKSRFGAALDLFARSRIIYYWRENRDLFTISDAELLCANSRLADSPAGFLAAERMAEFVLRAAPQHDPNPSLYGLLCANLDALAAAPCTGETLVASFLLKAASFLGFRPELRRCLVCRRPVADSPAVFDPGRGGLVCLHCSGEAPGADTLRPDDIAALNRLLLTPAPEVVAGDGAHLLDLVVQFVSRHFEPITLNSLR